MAIAKDSMSPGIGIAHLGSSPDETVIGPGVHGTGDVH